MTRKPSYKKLSQDETIDIGGYLKGGACVLIDGIATYRDGESDETVAAKFGVRAVLVSHLRRRIIGNTQKPRLPKATPDDFYRLNERMMRLEARVLQLEAVRTFLHGEQPALPLAPPATERATKPISEEATSGND